MNTPLGTDTTNETEPQHHARRRITLRHGVVTAMAIGAVAASAIIWGADTALATDGIGTGHLAEGTTVYWNDARHEITSGTMSVTDEDTGNTHTAKAHGGYLLMKVGDTEAYGYCIDYERVTDKNTAGEGVHSLRWPNTYKAEKQGMTQRYARNAGKVQWILENGGNPAHFASKFPGQDPSKVALGVQLAIWHYTDGVNDVRSDRTTTSVFNTLVRGAANQGTDTARPALNLSPASASGQAGSLIGPLKLDAPRATNVTATLGTPTPGVTLADSTGAPLPATLPDATKIYLKVDSSVPTGAVTVKVTGKASSLVTGMIAQGQDYNGAMQQSNVLVPKDPSTATIIAAGRFSWQGKPQAPTTTAAPPTTTASPTTTTDAAPPTTTTSTPSTTTTAAAPPTTSPSQSAPPLSPAPHSPAPQSPAPHSPAPHSPTVPAVPEQQIPGNQVPEGAPQPDMSTDTSWQPVPQLPALPMTGVAALTWQTATFGVAIIVVGGVVSGLSRRRHRPRHRNSR